MRIRTVVCTLAILFLLECIATASSQELCSPDYRFVSTSNGSAICDGNQVGNKCSFSAIPGMN